jgi:hypothetical protein
MTSTTAIKSLCLTTFIVISMEAQAGALLGLSARWNSFSFAAVDEEPTPNYYGFGFGIDAGYSISQIVDIAAYANYTPGRYKNAEILEEDAVLFGYGGELAVRIASAVYVGVHGGVYQYNLIHQRNDDEVRGSWAGTGGGLAVGAFFPINKSNYWQVALDFARINVSPVNDLAKSYVAATATAANNDGGAASANFKDRQIDSIAVQLTYLFNGHVSSREGGGLFNSFLNSMF